MAVSVCDLQLNNTLKEICTFGNADFPVACFEEDANILSIPIHWHDEYEYIATIKGSLTVFVGTNQVILEEGDSIFINSGCLHGVIATEGNEGLLRSLVILPKFIGSSSDSGIFQKLVIPFSNTDAPSYVVLKDDSDWQKSIKKAMLSAWSAVMQENYDYENKARYEISKAMRYLVDHLNEADTFKIESALIKRVKQAILFLEDHFQNDIGNSDLLEYLNCSESVLLRSFKQVTGTSPMQYLMNYRIQKATELLLTTDLKSCDVAASCGFKDLSYFTKIFKRTMGVTPMEYKKEATL